MDLNSGSQKLLRRTLRSPQIYPQLTDSFALWEKIDVSEAVDTVNE